MLVTFSFFYIFKLLEKFILKKERSTNMIEKKCIHVKKVHISLFYRKKGGGKRKDRTSKTYDKQLEMGKIL